MSLFGKVRNKLALFGKISTLSRSLKSKVWKPGSVKTLPHIFPKCLVERSWDCWLLSRDWKAVSGWVSKNSSSLSARLKLLMDSNVRIHSPPKLKIGFIHFWGHFVVWFGVWRSEMRQEEKSRLNAPQPPAEEGLETASQAEGGGRFGHPFHVAGQHAFETMPHGVNRNWWLTEIFELILQNSR